MFELGLCLGAPIDQRLDSLELDVLFFEFCFVYASSYPGFYNIHRTRTDMAITLTFDEFPEDYEPSDALADLFQASFDAAMDTLDETETLFGTLTQELANGERQSSVFADMSAHQALDEIAIKVAQASSDVVAYSVAYLAELSLEGEEETNDIIVVEGADRSMEHGYRVLQILDGKDSRVLYHGHCQQHLS